MRGFETKDISDILMRVSIRAENYICRYMCNTDNEGIASGRIKIGVFRYN